MPGQSVDICHRLSLGKPVALTSHVSIQMYDHRHSLASPSVTRMVVRGLSLGLEQCALLEYGVLIRQWFVEAESIRGADIRRWAYPE